MSPRGRYYHLFRDDDVPRLRQVFAPEGTIDDLLVELTKTLLVCGGQRMEGFELFATGTISSLPLSRDGGHYRIYLRKKNNPDPAAAAAA
ncbi:hypothetical protein EOL96_03435 [Candidatus Saccharibacteria bacterium]|nr:hypothetical protein [Candidatus Saccharibacteria bacterium]